MERKNYKLWVLSFTVLLSMVGLFFAVKPAEAAITRWALWHIDVTIPNNQMQTDLVIRLGHTTPTGTKVIDQVGTFSVPCQKFGNPVIAGGQVTFDGNSYFECDVPNIRDLVFQMSNGTLLIPASCPAKRPFIEVNATVNTTPTQINPPNPLFYRNDIQFSLPLDTSTNQAAVRVNFGQAGAESGAFTPTAGGHDITVLYQKTSNSTLTPIFTVDTTTTTAPPVSNLIFLSTLDSTVYFGYSPATGKYFEGTMGEGDWDPGCVGYG